MYTFPELLKKIREEAGLTQSEFAKILGVSTVLITMIETGQKEVSKNLIIKLAEKINVHPSSISPFLFTDNENVLNNITKMERLFLDWGKKMQTYLIKDRSKMLKEYAK
ncbi:MAG: Helix-turn-helix domain protein [Parcubacteria group bacterium GW2011_GWA2_43_17]|nr:MAG: Helix-turn-helix domain protein [Parcubacteria group bacterium GW2011_GWA2_43_17]OGY92844.1 MAG: hypothetical protein A2260_03765 [Candidatus Komeilibacteria bacterium RIFOXYA2_FULL_45_9]HAH04212.1 hypothetical protein [Candidatus Komeilibacteria bacterium]HCC73570.1 hypothetical protein [Candidatus Komeilibacteria bacterium]